MKITPNTPKNESGYTHLITMGESIRQIWVKQRDQNKHMSCCIKKPTNCICEAKGADQLCSNYTADQHL